MFCPNCGKEVAEGTSFCPGCGNKISNSASAPTPTPPPAPAPKSSKTAIIIAVTVVSVVIIIAAVVLIIFFADRDKDDPSSGSDKSSSQKDKNNDNGDNNGDDDDNDGSGKGGDTSKPVSTGEVFTVNDEDYMVWMSGYSIIDDDFVAVFIGTNGNKFFVVHASAEADVISPDSTYTADDIYVKVMCGDSSDGTVTRMGGDFGFKRLEVEIGDYSPGKPCPITISGKCSGNGTSVTFTIGGSLKMYDPEEFGTMLDEFSDEFLG